jgi:lysozyme
MKYDLLPALIVIKEFEGYYDKAYRDPVGIPTIGYGTIMYPNGAKVKMGEKCSKKEAEHWLMFEIEEIIPRIEKLIKVEVSNNQFCALVSFCYNLGTGALGKSTLLKKLNRGDELGEVGLEFKKWINAGGRPLQGLIRRREAERKLFLKA